MNKITAADLRDFFDEWGLHITDGISPCSGEDYEAMEEAAEALAKRITDLFKGKKE